VPPELERNVDLDWMRLSLADAESGIRPKDVERAARRMPPGAYRVVTTLEQTGLLQRCARGTQLKLEPTWLRVFLTHHAVQAVVARSPFEWGEALLRGHAAVQVTEALLSRTVQETGACLEPVLDLEAKDQPAFAAAVDVAFRVAGIARLLRVDVSSEVLEGLWRTQGELVLDLGTGLPVPRIELRPTSIWADAGAPEARFLLEPGTFYLAALSIAETLDRASVSALSLFDPFHQTAPNPALGAAYDAIAAAVPQFVPWRSAMLSLISRVRSCVGNVNAWDQPHSLEMPAEIIDEFLHGVLGFATLDRAMGFPGWLEAVLTLCEERGVVPGELARAFWTAWNAAERPDRADFLAPRAPYADLFWANIPEALLAAMLMDARIEAVPYHAFQEEQWYAFSRALRGAPSLVREHEAWAQMPVKWVTELCLLPLEWELAPRSVEVLWRRFPELLERAVWASLASATSEAAQASQALLQSAPREVAISLAERLAPRMTSLSPGASRALRSLLRRLVAERVPEWRRAYKSLAELEQISFKL
ncbi:MAG TPA: hypothetical protein VFQ61_30345, partial [Polyangiaceae bacterium]|nr:hypothetical protein [Polyangiaceae bacterium]